MTKAAEKIERARFVASQIEKDAVSIKKMVDVFYLGNVDLTRQEYLRGRSLVVRPARRVTGLMQVDPKEQKIAIESIKKKRRSN